MIGCSLAARAAQQLHDDAGIESSTIDRLLARIERHTTTLDDMTVVVVDEAAMVGTRKLVRLLAHAETSGAKVVLVGDPCQLPEIEAGGAFRGLQGRLGASRLTDNRRQTQPWERAALAELRSGDPDQTVTDYLAHDRIHQAATDDTVKDQLVDSWMTAHVEGEEVLIVAARLVDVDDLNRRARHVLRDEGRLGDDQVVLAGRPFAVGDTVLALRNDYQLGLLNGTRATIEQINTRREEMVLAVTWNDRVTVPFGYVEAGHLTHGYATTIHKAQGATVDRCFVLADDTINREHAYTALSRGRHGNDLYVVAEDRRWEDRHSNELEADPLDDLRLGLRRSAGKHFAVDQAMPPIRLLDHLRRERDELRHRIGVGPPDPGWDYHHLSEELARERHYRDGAQWRLDTARESRHALGPIGRRTHRGERRELEQRIARFESEIVRQDDKLVELEAKLAGLSPEMRARTRWERAHGTDLQRRDALDRQIQWNERIERGAVRSMERGLEREAGIDL